MQPVEEARYRTTTGGDNDGLADGATDASAQYATIATATLATASSSSSSSANAAAAAVMMKIVIFLKSTNTTHRQPAFQSLRQ